VKIAFLIRSLENGGAERQLTVLANELAERGHEVYVLVFYPGGVREHDVNTSLVRLVPMRKRSRWDVFGFGWQILRAVRIIRPDVIHGYLSAGNIAATLGRVAAPGAKLVWGIRDSDMHFEKYGWMTRLTYSAAFALSRLAGLVIFNSHAGLRYWESRGWKHSGAVCVPNGIDTSAFEPDPEARQQMRTRLGVPDHVPLIGMAGRFDPMKDHANFVRAATKVGYDFPDAMFVCAGGMPEAGRARLEQIAHAGGIGGRLLFPGPVRDMRGFYNALDVFCLSSLYGEGFPNVVGEAMACGRPCVVTDAGDAALVVGETGEVVPTSNPVALAKAICRVLDAGEPDSEAIRNRVLENFTVDNLASRTESLLGLRGRQSARSAAASSARTTTY